MGARGPVPNHSDDLARDRSRKGGEVQAITKGIARDTVVPEPDEDWHPIARMLWDSLAESGQSDFYQQSDWAFAFSLCDDLSFYKRPFTTKDGDEYHKRSGQMLQTIYSAMERLLVTEGDRRRVRIELDSQPAEGDSAEVIAISDAQAMLGLVPPLPDDESGADPE
jgi:hypothetical protein